jgi:hypothetical protein
MQFEIAAQHQVYGPWLIPFEFLTRGIKNAPVNLRVPAV